VDHIYYGTGPLRRMMRRMMTPMITPCTVKLVTTPTNSCTLFPYELIFYFRMSSELISKDGHWKASQISKLSQFVPPCIAN